MCAVPSLGYSTSVSLVRQSSPLPRIDSGSACSRRLHRGGDQRRQIHESFGKAIKYVKGVRDGDTFTEVPDEEIVSGYEYAKGQHVLIDPQEIDELKLEAKHTIDMTRFVDEDEIDIRYWEKPYYFVPDGDEAEEAYIVIREALKATRKVAVGQLILHGREHLVGIKPIGRGLMLAILRYAHEIRPVEQYFEDLPSEAKPKAVALAAELIEREDARPIRRSRP